MGRERIKQFTAFFAVLALCLSAIGVLQTARPVFADDLPSAEAVADDLGICADDIELAVKDTVSSASGVKVKIKKGSLQNGTAAVLFQNEDLYSGSFKNGLRNGSGKYKFSNGAAYSGNWTNDKINGSGTYKYPNGDKFKGTFLYGHVLDGYYMTSNSSGKYTFEVKDGTLTGLVKATLKNGNIYKGTINASGKFTGSCKIFYKNGDKYSGELANGLKSGTGTYKWKNGAKYRGTWKNDKMNGQGTYYYTASTYPRIKGTFANNKPSGTCTYYKTKSKVYTTVWSSGKCTSVKYK